MLLGEVSKQKKYDRSTDDCLQLGNLKQESPVIAE